MNELSWRPIGFRLAADHGHREWRCAGSEAGLALLPILLRHAGVRGEGARPFEIRLDQTFGIRVWERPGIDDEGIYGSSDDLKRLASLLEDRLASSNDEPEFRIDVAYAADAEYALVVRVTDESAGPIPPVTVNDGAGSRRAPEQPGEFPPFPFSFYDIEDDVESEGLFTLTDDAVFLEYHLKDDEAPLPEVQERILPLADLAAVTFKRGLISPLVTIQAKSMKALEGLPTGRLAQMTLRFKRKDRDDVERMVAALGALLRVEG